MDTGGLILGCAVTPASVGDREGARLLFHLGHAAWPRLARVWADGNYGGPLVAEARSVYGLDLEIVAKPQGQKGFSVLPRRWVVERTFSWLGKCRRLSKDYEQQPCMERAFIHVAMAGLMLRRLAK